MSAWGQALERVTCLEGDITTERVDAIVNAANERLRGGGGVDGAIHRAAGPGLLAECVERWPEGCPTGQARLTSGHGLPARFVIHTVGPVWHGGTAGEDALLAACHRSSLELAGRERFASVSFPAISTGAFGYPWDAAAEVALEAVGRVLAEHRDLAVRFVLPHGELLRVYEDARQRLRDALA